MHFINLQLKTHSRSQMINEVFIHFHYLIHQALLLMNYAATVVMNEFKGRPVMLCCCFNPRADIFIAYGQSDEYSFIFDKSTSLYSRRSDKIATNLVSLFTSAYCLGWKNFFPPEYELKGMPSFDARYGLGLDCSYNLLLIGVFYIHLQRI